METIGRDCLAWLRVGGVFSRYVLYRAGAGSRPSLVPVKYDCMLVVGNVLGWKRRLRMVRPENCPRRLPAVFCANHLLPGDPFITEAAIHLASGRAYWVDHMLREGFFAPRWKFRLADPDEMLGMLGAHHINRDRPSLGQLKVFVNLLCEGRGFLMFPGRTRSRSGLMFDYRDDITEPGGPSFFIAQAGRGRQGPPIPLVPVVRTFNPVDKSSAIVFGESLFLPHDTGREAQRATDFALVVAMGDLVEVHATHLLSAVFLLRAIHRRTAAIPVAALETLLAGAAEALPGRLVHPGLQRDPAREAAASLRYLQKNGMLSIRGGEVTPDTGRLLEVPSLDRSYQKTHPVRFYAAQTLHLGDVTTWADRAAEELG
jgi:1-acyl-sn-glycerol-3-phosphate acyltransferase